MELEENCNKNICLDNSTFLPSNEKDINSESNSTIGNKNENNENTIINEINYVDYTSSLETERIEYYENCY